MTTRYRLYKLPSGKTQTTIYHDAVDLPDEDSMVNFIQSQNLEELSEESDGNPRYVPEEFKADIAQQVYR